MSATARLLALCICLGVAGGAIHDPATAQTARPAAGVPAINGLEVNADAAFQPGSTLEFTVLATPRGVARVQVAGTPIDLALQERSPGVYVGSYTVRRADVLDPAALIRASLAAHGRTAEAEFRFPRSFAAAQASARTPPVVTPLPPASGTAPGPVLAPPPPAPQVRIDRFEATPVSRVEPGAQLRFVVEGVPGATVTVQWPELSGALLLREQQPGRYEGTYTLRQQDSLGRGPAVATLSSGERRVTAQLATPLVAARPPGPVASGSMGAVAATAVPVQLTSPLPNAIVDASQVLLQGRTTPGALVHVRVDAVPPAAPGRASVAQRLVQQTVRADADGLFSLPLVPHAAAPGTRLEVQFSATHGSVTSPEQRITLYQRQG